MPGTDLTTMAAYAAHDAQMTATKAVFDDVGSTKAQKDAAVQAARLTWHAVLVEAFGQLRADALIART